MSLIYSNLKIWKLKFFGLESSRALTFEVLEFDFTELKKF